MDQLSAQDIQALAQHLQGSAPEEVQEEQLIKEINLASVDCLNQDTSNPVSNLFVNDDTKYLASDADEQLLIFIPFKNKVDIKSITFHSKGDDTCPKTIKLFANKTSLDFDDASEITPTQVIKLTKSDAKDKKSHPLRLAKFTSVSSLTIFIEDNHGGDISTLISIDMTGRKRQGMNMKDLKKTG